MRRLIFKIHLFIAVIAGTFIVLLAVTGAILEFEPELDRLVHSRLSCVVPGKQTLSFSEVENAVAPKFGSEPIVAYLSVAIAVLELRNINSARTAKVVLIRAK
jgi:uncharacterized iron-regulated membrane protein